MRNVSCYAGVAEQAFHLHFCGFSLISLVQVVKCIPMYFRYLHLHTYMSKRVSVYICISIYHHTDYHYQYEVGSYKSEIQQMCIAGPISGIASKLTENINRLLFPPRYQHVENVSYLTIGTKLKEKKRVAKSFRLKKFKDFFLPFQI